jgi:hypothetical protein
MIRLVKQFAVDMEIDRELLFDVFRNPYFYWVSSSHYDELANSGRTLVRITHFFSELVVHEHPVVLPHVSHFMQVPLRTSVKLPHSPHISPS